MPPHRFAGNAEPEWIKIQPGYPLAPDAKIEGDSVMSMHPVHRAGQWSVQSVYFLRKRWPCYFTISFNAFGRRVHFNGGIKPDVTLGDWSWWFPDASATFNKAVQNG